MNIHIVRKVNGQDGDDVDRVVDLIRSHDIDIIDDHRLVTHDTVIIAVGGDGTVLHAAKQAIRSNCLVAGINVGHLGFLPDFGLDEVSDLVEYIKQLPDGIKNDCTVKNKADIELRRTITALDQVYDVSTALNEMFVKNATNQVLKCEVHIDGKLAFPFVGDGLIFSTPTGSTAYSLSAGGVIMDPMADAIQITPVASHMLTMRPIVVNANAKITLTCDQDYVVQSDGQTVHHIFGNRVEFRSHDFNRVGLIRNRAQHNTIFDVLKDKLYFSSRNG